jgi:hypothetical protein
MLKLTPFCACHPLALLFLVLLAGCSEEVAIRKYSVAKKDVQRVRPSGQAVGVEQRMLGAIVPRDDSAWYLKMVDVPDKVARYESDFRTIIENLSFNAQGEPELQISGEWDKKVERQIVYARLTHREAGVSATLTQLPAPTENAETWRDRVFADVNRWREQVSLQPLDWESMQADLEEVPTLNQGPAKAYLVSMTGKKSPSGMSAPFMQGMGMGGGPSPGTAPGGGVGGQPTVSPPAPATRSLKYEVPDGWHEEAASGIRLAMFTLASGESPAAVSVSTASGDPEMFLDMWFGQVGREGSEESKAAVLQQAETLQVNGVEATVYTIEGTDDRGILVSRIPWKGNEALFAKMTGTAQQIEEHRAQFLAFVNSLSW